MTGTFWIQFRGEYGILLIFFGEYICRAFFFETSWGVSTNPSEKNMIVNLDHLPQNRVVYIKKHVRIHHWSEKHAKTMAVFQAHLIISIQGIGSQRITNHDCVSRATGGPRVTPPVLQTIFNGYFISKHPNKQTNQEYTRAICTIWNPSTKTMKASHFPLCSKKYVLLQLEGASQHLPTIPN